MNTVDYLKQVKVAAGIQSDYALAACLGVTRSSISRLQKGQSTMADETAIRVANIIKVPAALVLADVHAEREKNPEIQAVWRAMVEKFSMGFEALISHADPRRRRFPAW